jgi:hypothetical protein
MRGQIRKNWKNCQNVKKGDPKMGEKDKFDEGRAKPSSMPLLKIKKNMKRQK